MAGIAHYGSFVVAIALFQLMPGPGTVTILSATSRHGRSAGMAAVAGTLCGDAVYMIAAIAGLAALLAQFPVAFHVLQWLGAGYLCWIGLNWLLHRDAAEAAARHAAVPASRYFRQALAVSLTNPKVVLFFVSFFPLFLEPGASSQTLWVMVLHVTLISLAYQALLVFVGNAAAVRLRRMPGLGRLFRRVAGIALISFGIRIAWGAR